MTVMATITYIEFDGREHKIEVASGLSVMRGAVDNQLRGIIAECGGNMSCGTCHVYVDPAWIDKVGDKSETEEILLEGVCDAQPNSRLSCQIEVTDALDNLVVRLPERQI